MGAVPDALADVLGFGAGVEFPPQPATSTVIDEALAITTRRAAMFTQVILWFIG